MPGNTGWNRFVFLRFLMMMTAFAAVSSRVAPAGAVDGGCIGARATPSAKALPDAWRAALDDLLKATAEPGHPWSCVGGTVELDLTSDGAVLRVVPDGEAPISRQVATPQDVAPLGQALLATALGSSDKREQPERASHEANPSKSGAPQPVDAKTPSSPAPGSQPSNASRRVLLGAGIDGRYVGASNIAWLGPVATASIVFGRWLPSVSFRQLSALTERPTLDELSFALGTQYRFDLSALELRTGLAFRGAAVHRVLPDHRGDQSRFEGRIGASAVLALPVLHWANVLLGADAEVVGFSRESAEPAPAPGSEAPTPFPSYTVGGSASFEVLL